MGRRVIRDATGGTRGDPDPCAIQQPVSPIGIVACLALAFVALAVLERFRHRLGRTRPVAGEVVLRRHPDDEAERKNPGGPARPVRPRSRRRR